MTANRGNVLWGGVSLLVLMFVAQLFLGGDTTEDNVVKSPKADPLVLATTQVAWDAVSEGQILVPREAPLEWVDVTVRNGDNLSLLFNRAGFSDRDVFDVTTSKDGKALREIFPGQLIGFASDDAEQLLAVRHIESPLKQTVYKRADGQFSSEVITRETETRERSVALTISSSLFLAGARAGLSDGVIMELAAILGGVIDFALDPRRGDEIIILFEENFLDDEKYSDGNILAASFNNNGRLVEAFRFIDSDGDVGYYDPEGVSMRKAFLKAPLDFTRVSSSFNPNRLHPIYKTKRPHRGTDYAAPRGTPVYAAGDGRVIEAGYSRANGNYIFIQHGEAFKTHYLHLNKKRVAKGSRVKQGQVIGTVGSTGAATGPHLHYEFLVNGVHRNPRTVHKILPKARSLPESELASFQKAIQKPVRQLAALKITASEVGAE
ncbi:peptidoglycan DD-metalloendopeptidase family protein [Candidatus Paraluminiphilus aquimaris]|uniref:peptidoglycan DD-metalloendopeptidase family protein n=1 Tax=Candidatus Paraluminiphilus aquimaris TaxID=2518994 RepID=UPI00242D1700|nr:peptidoglycan DD-metalloendopeptidase family protein [Candidatus Paraluminiphilus aquimaris]